MVRPPSHSIHSYLVSKKSFRPVLANSTTGNRQRTDFIDFERGKRSENKIKGNDINLRQYLCVSTLQSSITHMATSLLLMGAITILSISMYLRVRFNRFRCVVN